MTAILKRNELDPYSWNLAIPYADGTKYTVYTILHDDVISDSIMGINAGRELHYRNKDSQIVSIPIVIITRTRYDQLVAKGEKDAEVFDTA